MTKKFIFGIIGCLLLLVAAGILLLSNINDYDSMELGEKVKLRSYIENLRDIDIVNESNGKIGKDLAFQFYDSSAKRILIKDENNKTIMKMRLLSPYIVTGLIASPDTKVADFYLEDWEDGKNDLIDVMNFYDTNKDYEQINRNFRFKYGTEEEVCDLGDCWIDTQWTEFNTLDELPHKNIKISLWANTYPNEKIEWIPTIEGFEILQWAAWDITASILNSNFTVPGNMLNPQAVELSSNGDYIYFGGDNNKSVQQFSCSTRYDPETCTSFKNLSVAPFQNDVTGIDWSLGGTILTLTSASPIAFAVIYNCSVSEQLDSCVWGGNTTTLDGESDIVWNNDETSAYIVENTGWVNEYGNCGRDGILSTCTKLDECDINTQTTTLRGVDINSSGTGMIISGRAVDSLFEYYLPNQNLTDCVYTGKTFAFGGIDDDVTSIRFRPDGSSYFLAGLQHDSIYRFNISVPDETSPNVTINNPLNQSFTTNSLLFNVTAEDKTGVKSCAYSLDGGATNNTMTNATTSPANWNATNDVVPQGSSTAIFFCNDSNNNINNSESVTFFVDSAPPDVSITFPINNTNWSNVNLNVNFTRSDVSGLFNCWYSNDTFLANSTPDSSCNNVTSVVWSEGNHNVTVWANDTLGNVNASRISFTIDRVNPDVSIIFPNNNTNWNNVNLNVNFTRFDNRDLFNCWYSNDTFLANSTPDSSCNNVTLVVWSEGNHNVTVWANDTSGNINHSRISFSIDSINPDINITFPINNTNWSNVNLNVNFTRSDIHLFNCWYSNDTFLVNSTPDSSCNNVTSVVWSEGNHNVTVWANDTAGNINRSRISFTIDSVAPTVNITHPVNVDYQKLNVNLTINWSVSDLNLESCWGSFDGGTNNITLTCTDVNITRNITSINNNTFTFYANDSAGNIGNITRTWGYKVFQFQEPVFSSSTTVGATELFKLNFTQGAGLQTSTIQFIYNSTPYTSTFSVSSNNVTISSSLAIPSQNLSLTIPFYWNITMSDGSIINTTIYNQTVSILKIDNCSNYSTLIYNFTVFDEEEKTILSNTTIEVQMNVYDTGRTTRILNFSEKYIDVNPARVCINSSLLKTVNYSVDAVVKYTSNDSGNPYANEHYNILRQLLTNITVPRNINLYDLLDADSTEFQLTFKDSDLAKAPNILVNVFRQYVQDNDFKVVEIPLTDSNGQTVLHLVRNDVIYNIVMVNASGTTIAAFNTVTAFCEDFTIGLCTLNLDASAGVGEVYVYIDDLGISYTLPTFSNITNQVSFTFLSNDLEIRTVSTRIIKDTNFGNRTVCEGSLTSATGTVTCDVSKIISTDRFLWIDIFVDGELKAQSSIDLQADSKGFGVVNGAFYAFLLILLLITLFMDDKQVLVISLILGWLVTLSLGAISGQLFGNATIATAGIWLLVCVVIFLWKLKKEEVG